MTRARAEDGKKQRTRKQSALASRQQQRAAEALEANGGLTGKQVLALWELVLESDGTIASERVVKLKPSEVKGLASAGLVAIESGPRPKQPSWKSKLHLTEEGWAWASQQGLKGRFSRSPLAVLFLETLLGKLGKYLEIKELSLDHFLRPRRAEGEPEGPPSTVADTTPKPAPAEVAPTALEERISTAYRRVSGRSGDKHVRLALLRAELPGEAGEAVDAALRAMQQRGGAVLYPIDAPQRLRPEDDAAALRVGGERRDLLFIRG